VITDGVKPSLHVEYTDDTLPRPLQIALDQLDTEIRQLHEEAALAA
jgi:hypothetical protein